MDITDGLNVAEELKLSKVCILEKSTYGSKISQKNWCKRFSEEAKEVDLRNDKYDLCLYTRRKEGKMTFIVLYVDSMLVATNDKDKFKRIKIQLSLKFEMKDLGEPRNFLCLITQRNKNKRNYYPSS